MALPRRRVGARAAGADDERAQRRRPRRQLGRLPGVHGRAGRRRLVRARRCGWAPRSSTRSRRRCSARGLNTAVGDEGGFAPDLESNEAALQALIEGIEAAGYTPGEDVAIALDPATSEIFDGGAYDLASEGRKLSPEEMAAYWADVSERYPILSIEDGMDEEDWDGWKALTERLGERVQLVGDDLFVTNTERLKRGIDSGVGQLDPDQGQPDRHAHRDARRRSTWRARPATRRSCRTARARPRTRRSPTSRWPPAAGRSRPARRRARDRVAKYNQLLRIEEALGGDAEYPGRSVFRLRVELRASPHAFRGRARPRVERRRKAWSAVPAFAGIAWAAGP